MGVGRQLSQSLLWWTYCFDQGIALAPIHLSVAIPVVVDLLLRHHGDERRAGGALVAIPVVVDLLLRPAVTPRSRYLSPWSQSLLWWTYCFDTTAMNVGRAVHWSQSLLWWTYCFDRPLHRGRAT